MSKASKADKPWYYGQIVISSRGEASFVCVGVLHAATIQEAFRRAKLVLTHPVLTDISPHPNSKGAT